MSLDLSAHLCGERCGEQVCQLPDGHTGQHAALVPPFNDVLRWPQPRSADVAYLCRYCAWSTIEPVRECPKCGETEFSPIGPGSANAPTSLPLSRKKGRDR